MGTKLKTIKVTNIGCIGSEGLKVDLDDIVCLTGKNNSGKSTLLDSYVYAYDNNLPEEKKCKWGNGNPTIELWFYVSEEEKLRKKWCDKDGFAHIKWEWSDKDKTNTKWEAKRTGKNNITGNDEPNPLGADNVFKSYLPKPIRISSLEASSKKKEEDIFKDLLENFIPTDPESEIYKTFNAFKHELDTEFKKLSNSEELKNKKSHLQRTIKEVVSSSLEPSFDCSLSIDSFKLNTIVASSSKISLTDGTHTYKFHEQGTGAQRALFWSLLQLFPNKPSSKSNKSKAKKSDATDEELEECQEKRIILLIDEPENALHPHAIRKMCDLLYAFSEEEHKQVILTTHSPYFVNPTKDHTTIVRLERKDNITTPKAFRAKKCKFEEKELDNLKMLLKMDTALCEVFFGGYPIIVEGDTEYLSFLELAQEDDVQNALEEQNQEHFKIIRAVGKDTIIPIAKILAHFEVDFSVLHDLDTPLTKEGKKSPAWSANERIFNGLLKLKEEKKITVGHRVSNHTFEIEHAPNDTVPSTEKPWKMLEKIKEKPEDNDIRNSVKVELIRLIKAENAFEGITKDEFMPLILSWHETKNQTDSIAS